MNALSALADPRNLLRLLRPEPDLSTEDARARERHRRVALSAMASMAAKAITILASLISVPLTLRYLGAERYGIWIIISSLTLMLSFADMGLGNGVLNAVARQHGLDNRDRMRSIISSGYLMLAGVASFILIALAIGYPFIAWHRIANVTTPLAVAESGPAFGVFIVCFAIAVPLSLVQKVQIGLQQGFVTSMWQCLGSVLTLAGLLVVIWCEGGLPWLVAAFAGLPLVATAANSAVFFRSSGRDLRPAFRVASRRIALDTARAGGLFFLLQVIASLSYGIDSLIIAQNLGSEAVAQFSVPERMFAIISMVMMMMFAPLWPAYGEAIARGDRAWISRTLRRVVMLTIGGAAACAFPLVVAGPWLLNLWVGPSVQASTLLLLGLAVWKVVEVSGNALSTFMNGSSMLISQIVIAAVSGVAMVAMKIFLVNQIGVAGIPWAATATFVPLALLPMALIIRNAISRPAREIRS